MATGTAAAGRTDGEAEAKGAGARTDGRTDGGRTDGEAEAKGGGTRTDGRTEKLKQREAPREVKIGGF